MGSTSLTSSLSQRTFVVRALMWNGLSTPVGVRGLGRVEPGVVGVGWVGDAA